MFEFFFNFDCVVEEFDSEVFGVDEDFGMDVVVFELIIIVMVFSVSIIMLFKCVLVKKMVIVFKEIFSWFGF